MERLDNQLDANEINFDRKLDLITACAHPFLKEHLLTKISHENCEVIIRYISDFMTEVSPSQEYRIQTIFKLKRLAEYYHPRPLKELTRQDVVSFLDSFRKPESVDPLHKWIGTYETTRIILMRFFKWLYYPDLEVGKRPKPDVMATSHRLSAAKYRSTNRLTYGLKKMTRCFTSIVHRCATGVGMLLAGILDAGLMRCFGLRLKMSLYNN